MKKDNRRLRLGVLGCGPISQAAHLDAIRKARNADLYAICDVATGLTNALAAICQPDAVYNDFAAMLKDPHVEAVVIAVADQFHVPLCRQALAAGKPVLVEKPLGVTVQECEDLRDLVTRTGLVFQGGNNRRFEPGMTEARRFLREEAGDLLTLDAWYYDSVSRYTMQDNLYPVPVESPNVKRPAGDWKANRQRYLLITHGVHLLDTARFLAGPLVTVHARHHAHGEMHGWSIQVEFASGALGQLSLLSPRRGDFEEGFRAHGSVSGQAPLPWFQRARVECFKDGAYRRLLGEDGFTFRRQIEGFADVILHGAPQLGATLDNGIAAVRGLVAVSQSVARGEPVRLADASGHALSAEDELPVREVRRRAAQARQARRPRFQRCWYSQRTSSACRSGSRRASSSLRRGWQKYCSWSSPGKPALARNSRSSWRLH
jgi:predicted dehydrogenase